MTPAEHFLREVEKIDAKLAAAAKWALDHGYTLDQVKAFFALGLRRTA